MLQEGTFHPGAKITEKTSLTSGRKRVNRDYFFLPYFSEVLGVMVAGLKQMKGDNTVHKMEVRCN